MKLDKKQENSDGISTELDIPNNTHYSNKVKASYVDLIMFALNIRRCFVCRSKAEFYCKQTRVPICS